jgi:TonB family protein
MAYRSTLFTRIPLYATGVSFTVRYGSLLVALLLTLAGFAQKATDSLSCQGVFEPHELTKGPVFIGGDSALYAYLNHHIKYPDEAYEQGIQGKVYVHFVVDRAGMVKDAAILRGADPLLDREALRVVSSMPPWSAGMKECGAVDCAYTLPVSFKALTATLREPVLADSASAAVADSVWNLRQVDVIPDFPGGAAAQQMWLMRNMHYPDDAFEQNITGKVYVEFTVEVTGMIEDVALKKGRYPSLDQEALRLVKSMPRWTPGYVDGKAVRVRLVIPLTWALR